MRAFSLFSSPTALLMIACLFQVQGWAGDDVELAPAQAFSFREARATFVDLQSVQSHIVIQPAQERAVVYSRVEFETSQDGYPLLNTPFYKDLFELTLDGKSLDRGDFKVANMSGKNAFGSMRALPLNAKAGRHVAYITYSLVQTDGLLSFAKDKSAELFTNMDDFFTLGTFRNQGYLETLFPTNLQYDPYKFQLSVTIESPVAYTMKTNGQLQSTGLNRFDVTFPGEFTTNSFFIHVLPETEAQNRFTGIHKSIDGRTLPIEIYCDLRIDYCGELMAEVQKHLGELEERLGPFPYDRILYRNSYRTHGMEYAGAFTGSESSIRHELAHSWYGRGVKPASGRDGWLDEAVATWCENFRRASNTEIDPHQTYHDMTDTDQNGLVSTRVGYAGSRLFEKLDKLLEDHGGVAPVLKKFHRFYKGQVVTTAQFHGFLRATPGWNAQAEKLFNKMVYGRD